MYTTAYYSEADWNDTRFFRPDFDKLLLSARAELDQAKRASLYREMATMVRAEGGELLPTFNAFINAVTQDVQGYVHDNRRSEERGVGKGWVSKGRFRVSPYA